MNRGPSAADLIEDFQRLDLGQSAAEEELLLLTKGGNGYPFSKLEEILLNNKQINVNCVSPIDGKTPLINACYLGDYDMVKLLLHYGARVDVKSSVEHGLYSPLHAAADSGNLDTVKLLIENNADPLVIAKDGTIPLFSALFYPEVADYLISKGSPVNATDIVGNTPLHQAAKNGAPLKTVKLLLENGANFTLRNYGGKQTALELVRQVNDIETDIIALLESKENMLEQSGKQHGNNAKFMFLFGMKDKKIPLEIFKNILKYVDGKSFVELAKKEVIQPPKKQAQELSKQELLTMMFNHSKCLGKTIAPKYDAVTNDEISHKYR